MSIELECIETFGSPFVTVIPRDLITDFNKTNRGVDFDTKNHIGLSSILLSSSSIWRGALCA